MPLICQYCGAIREPGNWHYKDCKVVRMCLDPKYWPILEKPNNARQRIGKATGRSGDNIGWRKAFTRKLQRKAKR